MDRRENGIVLVFQVSTSPATRRIGWIEGQLGKEPLARSIARCNLSQLRNVCGTQWRVVIDPVEMWGVPFLYQLQFRGPCRLALPHLHYQLGKRRPVLGCGLWHFNVVEHISGMGFGFPLIENFCCGAGPDARQQLAARKPATRSRGFSHHRRILSTSLTCAASRNLRPPYFTNGMLRRVNSISSWALW